MEHKEYKQAIHYLETLYNFARKNKESPLNAIRRMQFLLDQIGNPEKNLKFIHIGGTNGKGSVSTMIHSILSKNNLTSGLFTSPHVTATIERISVNNKYIAPNLFTKYLKELKPHIEKAFLSKFERPSYTEILLAIALQYFQKTQCHYAIIEVGVGGKYDYTNVIPKPLITIITNIGNDHQSLLGYTTRERTEAKAGIIKKDTICITGDKRPQTIKTLRQICKKRQAKFITITDTRNDFVNNLLGNHQQRNANIAQKTCALLDISPKIIQKGISKTFLPARIEIIQKNPTIIIDVAHNTQKITGLVKTINDLTYNKLFLIMGITVGKSYRSIISSFTKIITSKDIFLATRYKHYYKQCVNPHILEQTARQKLPCITQTYLDAQSALNNALDNATKKDLIVITGSFFLAGELRENWYSKNDILKKQKSR